MKTPLIAALTFLPFLALAQTTPSTPDTTPPAAPTPGWHHHHGPDILTADEKAELKKAHDQAIASNGTLQTEENQLKTQREALKAEGANATVADKKSLHEQSEKFRQELRSAELQADPNLAPIFAKLDAARSHGGHHERKDNAGGSSYTPSNA